MSHELPDPFERGTLNGKPLDLPADPAGTSNFAGASNPASASAPQQPTNGVTNTYDYGSSPRPTYGDLARETQTAYTGHPQQPGPLPPRPSAPASRTWLNIASFVTALLWMSIVAIILGHLGLAAAKRGQADLRGLGIAGLVVGYLGAIAWTVMWISVFWFAREYCIDVGGGEYVCET